MTLLRAIVQHRAKCHFVAELERRERQRGGPRIIGVAPRGSTWGGEDLPQHHGLHGMWANHHHHLGQYGADAAQEGPPATAATRSVLEAADAAAPYQALPPPPPLPLPDWNSGPPGYQGGSMAPLPFASPPLAAPPPPAFPTPQAAYGNSTYPNATRPDLIDPNDTQTGNTTTGAPLLGGSNDQAAATQLQLRAYTQAHAYAQTFAQAHAPLQNQVFEASFQQILDLNSMLEAARARQAATSAALDEARRARVAERVGQQGELHHHR